MLLVGEPVQSAVPQHWAHPNASRDGCPGWGVRGAGGLGEQPPAVLSGFFSAQSAVPGWEALGSFHGLVGALISCSTSDQSNFWVPSQRESFGVLSTSDM